MRRYLSAALLFAVAAVSMGCQSTACNSCSSGSSLLGKPLSAVRSGGGNVCQGCRAGHHCRHNQPEVAGPPTATYANPYYTLRGPRDFLQNNPPSIGPY